MFDIWPVLGTAIAWILTVAVISITMWKDNPSGNIAETVFVVGEWSVFLVTSLQAIWGSCILPITRGDYIKIIPFLMGFLFLGLYYRPTRHVARLSTALIVGVSMGLAFRGMIEVQLLAQMAATVMPLTGVSTTAAINNLWIIVTTILTIIYFTFTIPERKSITTTRKVARYAIMIMFGAGMGAAVWTSAALLIDRFLFLIKTIRGF